MNEREALIDLVLTMAPLLEYIVTFREVTGISRKLELDFAKAYAQAVAVLDTTKGDANG